MTSFDQAVLKKMAKRGITQLTEKEKPTWKEVLAALDARAEADKREREAKAAAEAAAQADPPVSLVDQIKAALEPHQQRDADISSLNDARLLTALSNGDGTKAAKEAVARLLHDYRQRSSTILKEPPFS